MIRGFFLSSSLTKRSYSFPSPSEDFRGPSRPLFLSSPQSRESRRTPRPGDFYVSPHSLLRTEVSKIKDRHLGFDRVSFDPNFLIHDGKHT